MPFYPIKSLDCILPNKINNFVSFLARYPKDYSDFNYYEILGVNRTDIQEEIKHRFHEMSLKFHPDK
jgi:preprotein translocase subunit Sec63